MNKRFRRIAVASALGAAWSLSALSTPAQAATTKCAYEGSDRACATNYTSTSSLEVCDNENDGHSVTGWFKVSDGTTTFLVDDYGGSCNTASDIKVVSFYIQEAGGGKSGTVYM